MVAAVDMSRSDLVAERDALTARLANVETEIESIKAELAGRLSGLQEDAQKVRSALGQVGAEIARREALDAVVPTISDHALLRYIERRCGVDIEAMKAALLTDSVVKAIKAGATALRTTEGTLVIKGSSVVTFLPPEMRAKRKTLKGMRQQDDDDFDGDAA